MSQYDLIKELFGNLSDKVDNLQTKQDAKSTEDRLTAEIKELKTLYMEQQKTLARHDGHFNTIKIFTTTGVASLIAFYSWVVSIVEKIK